MPADARAIDAVHPGHYSRGGMECADAMRAMMYGLDITNMEAYWLGCAMKYIWRFAEKNGVEDLEKARECLRLLIEEHERD